MEKFTRLTALAAPLDLANVDTDKIIPARFLKTIKRSGLGIHLFDTLRYNENEQERPEFVLNQEPDPRRASSRKGDDRGTEEGKAGLPRGSPRWVYSKAFPRFRPEDFWPNPRGRSSLHPFFMKLPGISEIQPTFGRNGL